MDSTLETTLLNNIKIVLSDFPEYWDQEILLKSKVIEDLRSYDEKIITTLLNNEKIKETYALSVGDMTIFKVEEFIEMLRYKTYWENSYTKYRNEIGLTSDGKYLNYNTDVVLDFPFKDCVLEGGMSNEDEGKKEVYYHNVIAKEEIDTLLSPKVLTNLKKYDKDGEHKVAEFNDNDSLVLKGNNLLALHTLKDRYAGKVKLIYIDPPYNTGNDSFQYNDRFNHSSWLTFMKNRLEIAKELLAEDGALFITLDDNELHYLKVITDDIFGRKCFINTIAWKHSDNSNNNALKFSEDFNYNLVYSKNDNWKPNFLNDLSKRTHFKNPDNDPRGPWFDGNPINNPGLRKNLQFSIETPNGNIINHPPNGWRWSRETMNRKFKTGELRFSNDQTRVIRRTYLEDMEGLPPSTLWTNLELTGHTRKAKYELKKLFPDTPVTSLFTTPKPELLIKHIIELTTKKGDIVLDFFMGSATTQAVAMKMNRQFIGVEQMDYINTVSVPRLQKVVNGEQGGISKEVDWQGGGSFIYAELDSLNQQYIDKLNEITSEEKVESILEEMKSSAYLNFKVELNKVTTDSEDFSALSLDDKKKVLLDVLDMNQVYLNYSEIDDTQYDISDAVKQFNHSFYGQGGE